VQVVPDQHCKRCSRHLTLADELVESLLAYHQVPKISSPRLTSPLSLRASTRT
jgi:hypothetical protein